MNKKKLIKDINRKWLISYLLFHIVLFAIFATLISPTFSDITELLLKLKSPSGFLPILSFPFTIVFEGILHSNLKAIIVFWRLKNTLPGNRAFSVIARNDPRIDLNKLLTLFPNGFPEKPKDQNSAWYQLFRKFSDTPTIYDAHKSFLLTRDLASLTFILMPFLLTAHLFWKTPGITIFYHILLLVVMMIIISLSAQNYGKRFVANVLVEATL